MCEEKPALVKVTGTTWALALVCTRTGRDDTAGKAATVRGTLCTQQFMGHCSGLPALKLRVLEFWVLSSLPVMSWQ